MSAVVFRLMVVLLILVQATPSRAQKTVGYGETSCKLWTKERRTETAISLAYSGWVLGFVSGVNAIGILTSDESRDFLKTAVAKQLIAWVDEHCHAHPDDHLDSAAFALIAPLKGKWN
jgi:hypothetical protein